MSESLKNRLAFKKLKKQMIKERELQDKLAEKRKVQRLLNGEERDRSISKNSIHTYILQSFFFFLFVKFLVIFSG